MPPPHAPAAARGAPHRAPAQCPMSLYIDTDNVTRVITANVHHVSVCPPRAFLSCSHGPRPRLAEDHRRARQGGARLGQGPGAWRGRAARAAAGAACAREGACRAQGSAARGAPHRPRHANTPAPRRRAGWPRMGSGRSLRAPRGRAVPTAGRWPSDVASKPSTRLHCPYFGTAPPYRRRSRDLTRPRDAGARGSANEGAVRGAGGGGARRAARGAAAAARSLGGY